MANTVSYEFLAIDNFTAVAKKIAAQTEVMRANLLKFSNECGQVSLKLNEMATSMLAVGKSIRQFGMNATIFATLPIIGIGTAAVKTAAHMETLQTKLNVMAGGEKQGKKLFDQLINFEKYTPFNIDQWLPAQNMLISAGVKPQDLIRRMTGLGNLAAAASGPGGDTGAQLNQVVQAYREIAASGIVQKRDFLKFTRRGIDLPSSLEATTMEGQAGIKNIGTPKAYQQLLTLMKQGKVTADMFNKAMDLMTGKGGRYENMMGKLAQTTQGLFTTMQTGWIMAKKALGDAIIESEGLKDVLRMVTKVLWDFAKNFPDWEKKHKWLFKIILDLLLFIAVVGPLALILGSLISIFGVLLNVSSLWFAALWKGAKILRFILTLPFGGWLLGIAAVVGIVAVLFPKTFKEIMFWVFECAKAVWFLIKALWHLTTGNWGAIAKDFGNLKSEVLHHIGGGTINKNQNNVGVSGAITLHAPQGTVKSASMSTSGGVGSLGFNLATPMGGLGAR